MPGRIVAPDGRDYRPGASGWKQAPAAPADVTADQSARWEAAIVAVESDPTISRQHVVPQASEEARRMRHERYLASMRPPADEQPAATPSPSELRAQRIAALRAEADGLERETLRDAWLSASPEERAQVLAENDAAIAAAEQEELADDVWGGDDWDAAYDTLPIGGEQA